MEITKFTLLKELEDHVYFRVEVERKRFLRKPIIESIDCFKKGNRQIRNLFTGECMYKHGKTYEFLNFDNAAEALILKAKKGL